MMRAAPRPEPVREPEELLLVDRVQHFGRRPLNDLVLQGGDRKRALSTVRLGNVDPPGWLCPVRSSMEPRMQVRELALEVCLVVRPGQPIHPGGGILLELEEHLLEEVEAEMVEERGEPLLFPFPCDFPYALQRL